MEHKPFLEARVTQLAKEFPPSHGTLKFIMLFTGPLNPTPDQYAALQPISF